MKGFTLLGSTSAAVLLVGAALLFAGPLDPPSGPVSGTYKTLSEVEPRTAISSANTPGDATSLYKITKPGSYYLTGNVTGKSGRYGIYIEADNVTLDLSGFALTGVAGSLDGIQGYEGIRNTTIRNGTVSGWARSGIYIGGGSYGVANGFRLEGITASDNGRTGISAGYSGVRGVIARCVAHGNGLSGIESFGDVVVELCAAIGNTSDGIVVSNGGTVRDCVSNWNGSIGILAGNAIVSGCSLYANAEDGIRAVSGCLITGNGIVASGYGAGNSGAGILITGNDNRLEGNNCTTADQGIAVNAPGNIIIRNTCSGNATNWVIVAGNALAPIVSATTNANAVNGNTYSGNLGSTDPNANFTY